MRRFPAFELSESTRTERGTTITLTLQEEEQEYLEASRIKQLIKTYCDFMQVTIKFEGEELNKHKAIWRDFSEQFAKRRLLRTVPLPLPVPRRAAAVGTPEYRLSFHC